MKPKKLWFAAFILVAIAELFIPWQMISKQAGFADTGKEFKFKTDSKFKGRNNRTGASLQGKYVLLHFEQDEIRIKDRKEWAVIENAYIQLNNDSAGFAEIQSVTKVKPKNTTDWIRARVFVKWNDSTSLVIVYPFNKYFIEDTKHKSIDSVIKYGLNDSVSTNYLLVKIKENQFLSRDLIIDGISFKERIEATKKHGKIR